MKSYIVNVIEIHCQPVVVQIEDNEGDPGFEAIEAVRNGDGEYLPSFYESTCEDIKWDVEPLPEGAQVVEDEDGTFRIQEA